MPSAVITPQDWESLPSSFHTTAIRGPFPDERFELRTDGWCIVWPEDPSCSPYVFNTRGNEDCNRALTVLRGAAERVEGDAPHHGYVNTDAAHMPEGVAGRLEWDARLRQRGERDES